MIWQNGFSDSWSECERPCCSSEEASIAAYAPAGRGHLAEWRNLDERIAAFDAELVQMARTDEAARRLATIPPGSVSSMPPRLSRPLVTRAASGAAVTSPSGSSAATAICGRCCHALRLRTPRSAGGSAACWSERTRTSSLARKVWAIAAA